MSGSNKITSRQLALVTFVAQTGMGITTLPTFLAKEIGRDGWISVVLAGAVAVMASTLIGFMLRRYSDKSIFEINQFIFGKAIGKAMNILLTMYVMLAAAANMRVFILFLRLTLLPKSPPLLMSPFVLLPSVYLVWLGLKNICRFKYISILSYMTFVLYVGLIAKDIRLSFLMPLGESGLMPLISSVKIGILSFVGMELVAFIFPEVVDKKKALKWHVSANVISMMFLLLIVASCTAVFGERLVQTLTVPLFNLARVYHAPVVERVDLYLTALWFVAMGCSMRVFMFVGFYSIIKVFNLKKSKLLLVLYFAILMAISRIPRDINQVYMFVKITNWTGVAVSGYFIACLAASFIRPKGVKAVESD